MKRTFDPVSRLFGGSGASGPALGLALAALGLSGACADRQAQGTPPAHSTAQPEGSVPGPVAITEAVREPTPEDDWIEAVRVGRWAEAAKKLDALDPAVRETPPLRFARARVAAQLGDHKLVLDRLEGIELPLLDEEIQELRAEAASHVGPYELAAKHFAKSARPRDMVRAAEVHQRAGNLKEALTVTQGAVAAAQRVRRFGDERAARALRAQLYEALGRGAEGFEDLRWLAFEAPGTGDGKAARKKLLELGKLSDKERFKVAQRLVQAGEGSLAVLELDALAGKGASRAETLHLRAEALFKARRWAPAAEALSAASKVQSGRTAEQIYLMGRALERVDRLADAQKAWRETERRFPKTEWADRAAYQLARSAMSDGEFSAARDGFVRYLATYPKGQLRDSVEYELALSYLSSGDADKARERFRTLASRSSKLDVGVLRQLEGVAAHRAGDAEAARKLWLGIIREQPLTWAAAMARARLAAVGAALPAKIDPPGAAQATPFAVDLPAKAGLLRSLGLDVDAERWLEKNEQTVAARYVGRESEALCAMYAKLSRAKRRYRVGAAAVSFESLMRAPSADARWGWECVYPRPYASLVGRVEMQHDLPPGLVHALMRQESTFDPDIRSPVGASGLMQLMPATAEQAAKEVGLDFEPSLVNVPEVNVTLGGFYIGKLIKTFGSVPVATASYNAGPGAVSRWLKSRKETEMDLWVARIPFTETRNYVVRVMGNLLRYQYLAGGEAAVQEISLDVPDAQADRDAY